MGNGVSGNKRERSEDGIDRLKRISPFEKIEPFQVIKEFEKKRKQQKTTDLSTFGFLWREYEFKGLNSKGKNGFVLELQKNGKSYALKVTKTQNRKSSLPTQKAKNFKLNSCPSTTRKEDRFDDFNSPGLQSHSHKNLSSLKEGLMNQEEEFGYEEDLFYNEVMRKFKRFKTSNRQHEEKPNDKKLKNLMLKDFYEMIFQIICPFGSAINFETYGKDFIVYELSFVKIKQFKSRSFTPTNITTVSRNTFNNTKSISTFSKINRNYSVGRILEDFGKGMFKNIKDNPKRLRNLRVFHFLDSIQSIFWFEAYNKISKLEYFKDIHLKIVELFESEFNPEWNWNELLEKGMKLIYLIRDNQTLCSKEHFKELKKFHRTINRLFNRIGLRIPKKKDHYKKMGIPEAIKNNTQKKIIQKKQEFQEKKRN